MVSGWRVKPYWLHSTPVLLMFSTLMAELIQQLRECGSRKVEKEKIGQMMNQLKIKLGHEGEQNPTNIETLPESEDLFIDAHYDDSRFIELQFIIQVHVDHWLSIPSHLQVGRMITSLLLSVSFAPVTNRMSCHSVTQVVLLLKLGYKPKKKLFVYANTNKTIVVLQSLPTCRGI